MPIVVYSDFSKLFILYMDALSEDIEAVLYQKSDNRKEWIIAYISRIFNEYKKKYLIIEQECLTMI